METRPVTASCEAPFHRGEHVCFGISPFNSYFTESRIEGLARWGAKHFRSMHFFVPDAATVFTLEAVGYDAEKAAWKARRQCQYLHNKIMKAVEKVGYFPDEVSEMILNGGSLSQNPHYRNLSDEVHETFSSDGAFRSACLEATSWVLEGKLPPGAEIQEHQSLHAVRYLHAEIPLFLDSAGITGRASSVFAYHQCIPFIQHLLEGKYPVKRSEGQGFVVAKPFDPDGSPALSAKDPTITAQL